MAKSKVKKGFFFYLMVLAFVIFGIFCILFSILIFNPGVDVYGLNLRYISYIKSIDHYKLTGTETLIQSISYDTVEFTSGYTNFNISYSEEEVNTKIVLDPNVTALSNKDNIKFSVVIKLEGSKLVISVTEPEIWIGFYKGSTINFVCPKDTSFENVAFNINTNSGAVSVGDLSTNKYAIKDLNIKTTTGAISIYNNMDIVSQNINIQTNKSKMNISSNVGALNIENAKGKIVIGTLAGDLHLTNSDVLEVNGTNVGGDVYIKAQNGYVNIKNLGISQISKNSKTSNVYGYVNQFEQGEYLLGYIKGNLTTFDVVDNVNITIGSMVGNATITGNTGFVKINKLNGQALIETTNGAVSIKEANKKLDITTTKGSVEVIQTGENVNTTVNTQSGKIVAKFVKVGNVILFTKSSNIEISVATGEAFNLTYLTKKGINVSWATTEWEKSGSASIFGATASTTSSINASAEDGKIILNDGFVA